MLGDIYKLAEDALNPVVCHSWRYWKAFSHTSQLRSTPWVYSSHMTAFFPSYEHLNAHLNEHLMLIFFLCSLKDDLGGCSSSLCNVSASSLVDGSSVAIWGGTLLRCFCFGDMFFLKTLFFLGIWTAEWVPCHLSTWSFFHLQFSAGRWKYSLSSTSWQAEGWQHRLAFLP